MKDKDFNLPHDENDTIKLLNCIKKDVYLRRLF